MTQHVYPDLLVKSQVLANDYPADATACYETWDLEAKTALAAGYWDSVSSMLDKALIERFGLDRWLKFVEGVFTAHQREFFTPGLEKCGIPATAPDAVRAAAYHLISNALGNIRTRMVIESDRKAWILYLPSAGTGDEPLHGQQQWEAIFRGWHAKNGVSLGNLGLAFVATHMLARGDEFTGGYFIDTGESLELQDRFRTGYGEEAPGLDVRMRAQVSEASWPTERRQKAAGKFSTFWAWDKIVTALEVYGPDASASIVTAVTRASFGHLPVLQALGGEGINGLARGFGSLLDASGWSVTNVDTVSGDVGLALSANPVHHLITRLPNELAGIPYEALRTGWAKALSPEGVTIRRLIDAEHWLFSKSARA